MCGITGLVEFGSKIDIDILDSMTDAINKRGPDDKGIYEKDDLKYSIGLGHRRLSILDLSDAGHQPMHYDNLVMVYNGEVYNFKEIRLELESNGYNFYSDSDSEVIIKGFHFWGYDLLQKLNGMYAIAIYDLSAHKLMLIRDRAGVKPIYYSMNDEHLLFSSELKSFHCHPNFDSSISDSAMRDYFSQGYVSSKECIFSSCQKVEPGSYIEFDLNEKTRKIVNYWSVYNCYNKNKLNISENEAIDKVESLLTSSSMYRMISDVPVGVFLSGGYDSSLLAAILSRNTEGKIKTYTIGFEESGFNEAVDAKIIAEHLGTEHKEFYCSEYDCIEIVDELTEIWDEPFADNSAIPTYLVSKMAKSDVKVVLSADGGDELFAGYEKYNTALKLNGIYKKLPKKELLSNVIYSVSESKLLNKCFNSIDHRLKRISDSLLSKDEYSLMKSITCVFSNRELDLLLLSNSEKKECNDLGSLMSDKVSPLDKMLAIDYATWQVDDILQKVDRATMSNSIEGREPFLDFRLVEYIARLPTEYKINKGNNKYLLKKISENYIPKNIMDRPKKGFNIPIEKWLNEGLLDKNIHLFSRDYIENQGLFSFNQIDGLIKKFENNDRHASYKLWTLMIFQNWYSKWVK